MRGAPVAPWGEATPRVLTVAVVRRGHLQLGVRMARNTARVSFFLPRFMVHIFSKIIASDVKASGVRSVEAVSPPGTRPRGRGGSTGAQTHRSQHGWSSDRSLLLLGPGSPRLAASK